MTGKLKKCPFKVGNIVVYRVVYRPSERGWALEVMASPEGKLIPGKEYVVSEIQDDAYFVVGIQTSGEGGSTGLNLN